MTAARRDKSAATLATWSASCMSKVYVDLVSRVEARTIRGQALSVSVGSIPSALNSC